MKGISQKLSFILESLGHVEVSLDNPSGKQLPKTWKIKFHNVSKRTIPQNLPQEQWLEARRRYGYPLPVFEQLPQQFLCVIFYFFLRYVYFQGYFSCSTKTQIISRLNTYKRFIQDYFSTYTLLRFFDTLLSGSCVWHSFHYSHLPKHFKRDCCSSSYKSFLEFFSGLALSSVFKSIYAFNHFFLWSLEPFSISHFSCFFPHKFWSFYFVYKTYFYQSNGKSYFYRPIDMWYNSIHIITEKLFGSGFGFWAWKDELCLSYILFITRIEFCISYPLSLASSVASIVSKNIVCIHNPHMVKNKWNSFPARYSLQYLLSSFHQFINTTGTNFNR